MIPLSFSSFSLEGEKSSIRISNQAHESRKKKWGERLGWIIILMMKLVWLAFSLFNHPILAQIAARGVLKGRKLFSLASFPQIALFFIAHQFKFVYRELETTQVNFYAERRSSVELPWKPLPKIDARHVTQLSIGPIISSHELQANALQIISPRSSSRLHDLWFFEYLLINCI